MLEKNDRKMIIGEDGISRLKSYSSNGSLMFTDNTSQVTSN